MIINAFTLLSILTNIIKRFVLLDFCMYSIRVKTIRPISIILANFSYCLRVKSRAKASVLIKQIIEIKIEVNLG